MRPRATTLASRRSMVGTGTRSSNAPGPGGSTVEGPGHQRPHRRDDHDLGHDVDRPRAQEVERRAAGRLADQIAVVGVGGEVEHVGTEDPAEGDHKGCAVVLPTGRQAEAPDEVDRRPDDQQVQRPEREEADVGEGLAQGGSRDPLRRERQAPVEGETDRPPVSGPQRNGCGRPGQVAEVQGQADPDIETGQRVVELERHDRDEQQQRESAARHPRARTSVPSSEQHRERHPGDEHPDHHEVRRAVGLHLHSMPRGGD